MKIKEFFYTALDTKNQDDIPEEWWLERFRIWRNQELKATDWTQLSDAPTDAIAWALYRQKLRDLPEIKDFANAEFPQRPV